jgi:hypothetical protein
MRRVSFSEDVSLTRATPSYANFVMIFRSLDPASRYTVIARLQTTCLGMRRRCGGARTHTLHFSRSAPLCCETRKKNIANFGYVQLLATNVL